MPEQGVEGVGAGQVVVVLQRRQPQRLAEAARAQQQELIGRAASTV
jgi:hypothetical protein